MSCARSAGARRVRRGGAWRRLWVGASLLALSALALAAPAPPDADAHRRMALVIGNASYPGNELANPVHDARDMAALLRSQGFVVLEAVNQRREPMLASVRAFTEALRPGDAALVYYAGHGLQLRGRNFLLPVDARIATEDDVPRQALDLGALMAALEQRKAWVNLLILDACRNNPFGRGQAGGLAPMDAPRGTLIAFATAPGKKALDGQGRNGLYTRYLLSSLAIPGLKIEDVMKRVRVGVSEESQGAQIPWENTSMTDDFVFQPAAAGSLLPDASPLEAQEARIALRTGSAEVLRQYLQAHPRGAGRGEVVAALLAQVRAGPLWRAAQQTYLRDGPDGPPLVPQGGDGNAAGTGAAIGAFLVTVDDYQRCVSDKACPQRLTAEFGGGSFPAVNVSAQDARRYTAWLSARTGRRYRLPTAGEWMAAFQAGQAVEVGGVRTPLPWVPCQSANSYDQSGAALAQLPWPEAACSDGFPHTSPVGLFQPDARGLYDVLGNVWQWTDSCAPGADGACAKLQLRGGSWASPLSALQGGGALAAEPDLAGNTIGFRVYREAR